MCLRWSPTPPGPRWPPALLKRERKEERKGEKFYIYSDVTHTCFFYIHTHTRIYIYIYIFIFIFIFIFICTYTFIYDQHIIQYQDVGGKDCLRRAARSWVHRNIISDHIIRPYQITECPQLPAPETTRPRWLRPHYFGRGHSPLDLSLADRQETLSYTEVLWGSTCCILQSHPSTPHYGVVQTIIGKW